MKEFHLDIFKIIRIYGILSSNQRQDFQNMKHNIAAFISHWFLRRKKSHFFLKDYIWLRSTYAWHSTRLHHTKCV